MEYGDKKWIVSTVGSKRDPLDPKKMDTVGAWRWYETMAFVATEQNGYIDADVSQEIGFESKWGLFGETWDKMKNACGGYPDNAANDMHEKVVAELCEKIIL